MGQLDQLGKRTFASDAPPASHGAAVWRDGAEIGLTHLQPDGYLVVLAPWLLAELPAPWSEAIAYPGEILVELKMPGDHLDALTIDRAELRRLARQIQRAEDVDAPFSGLEPLWLVAPHLPPAFAERGRRVERVAPGCYRVDTGSGGFSFLWVAANELPLRAELIPFLVVRSGKALEAFVLWVADHRPVDWVLDVVQYAAMTPAARTEMLKKFRRSDDPEVRERQRQIVREMLEINPDLREESEQQVRLAEARSNLRRVLARRGFVLSIEEQAQIEACAELGTLERWLEEAVTAASATEALR
ncbi:MAG: hypothetical protein U0359_12845 [Byssovorax sp.]